MMKEKEEILNSLSLFFYILLKMNVILFKEEKSRYITLVIE
jgi:hypothetical protein